MRGAIGGTIVGLVLSLGPVEPAAAACAPDSVTSGTVCMDAYEASVWHVPSTQRTLIRKIQKGTVTLANLTAGGAVQLGLATGDLAAAGCPVTGNGCVDFYAVSIPGVLPAAYISWFQAAAAARNSLKRLPTNQEWQVAALGTPDGFPCNVNSAGVANTGSAAGCVSDVGAFDMVGNLYELVADWGDKANSCGPPTPTWSATFGSDQSCVGGPGAPYSNFPGTSSRGGSFFTPGSGAGVFAVAAGGTPDEFGSGTFGFRCAR